MESRVFTITPINDRPTGAINALIIPSAGANFGDPTTLVTAGPVAAKVGDFGLFAENGAPLVAGTATFTLNPRVFIGVIAADATGAMKGIKTEIFDGKCMGRSNLQAAQAQTPKTVVIGGWSAECETEYCVKIRYESPRVYQTYGYQSLVKSYNFVSSCCGPSCACPDGNFAEVGNGIVAAINADPDMLVTAAYTAESTPGTSGDGFITLTGTFETEGTQGLNPTYVENNSPLDFYVGLDCGFDCNGQVFEPDAIITGAVAVAINANVGATLPTANYAFGEGLGPDIIAKELYADGWQTSPYRIPFPLSQKTLGNNFYALAANTYSQITIEYKDCHPSAITATDVASPKKAIIALDTVQVAPGAPAAALIVLANVWLATTPTGQLIA